MGEVELLRRCVRPMLDFDAPVDALYVYYALYHDPARTRLLIQEGEMGRVDGFMAVCQIGRKPLCILAATNDASLALAKSVGYVDTGAQEYAAEGIYTP